jgi:hypothetical protein
MIDKNMGVDYPAPDLRRWKRDHEKLVHECLEGGKRLVFNQLVGSGGDQLAKVIESPRLVWESLSDLRKSLTAFRVQAPDGSDVDILAESMIKACRHYMNTTSPDIPHQEMEYSLGAVRKIIGVNVKSLLDKYPMQVSSELMSILPDA